MAHRLGTADTTAGDFACPAETADTTAAWRGALAETADATEAGLAEQLGRMLRAFEHPKKIKNFSGTFVTPRRLTFEITN